MTRRSVGASRRGEEVVMGKGRGARISAAGMLGAVIRLAAPTARAATGTSPFEFSGHWTGTATQEGQPVNALMADFTSTGPKTFTGTVTADYQCSASGKLKRHMKVAVRLDCGDGKIVKIRGHLDPTTATVEGNFTEFQHRRPRHRGTFVLSRQNGGGGSGSATVSFFSGATPAGHPAALHAVRPHVVPKDGQWYLSPDQMILTVTSIELLGGSTGAVAVNCPFTYDRSQPGLTKLSDCPIAVAAGTYSGLNVEISPTYQVLIDDPDDGFYSTSTGILTSPPARGAQYLTVTTTSLGISSTFPAPIDAGPGASPTLSVVVNGLQFFRVQVSGGVVSLGWPDVGDTDPRRPDMTVSVSPLASVAF